MSLVADYIDLFPILFGSNHLHSCHSQCLSCVRLHNEKDDAGLAVQVVLAILATLAILANLATLAYLVINPFLATYLGTLEVRSWKNLEICTTDE